MEHAKKMVLVDSHVFEKFKDFDYVKQLDKRQSKPVEKKLRTLLNTDMDALLHSDLKDDEKAKFYSQMLVKQLATARNTENKLEKLFQLFKAKPAAGIVIPAAGIVTPTAGILTPAATLATPAAVAAATPLTKRQKKRKKKTPRASSPTRVIGKRVIKPISWYAYSQ